jgi:hypothetical protein
LRKLYSAEKSLIIPYLRVKGGMNETGQRRNMDGSIDSIVGYAVYFCREKLYSHNTRQPYMDVSKVIVNEGAVIDDVFCFLG